MKDVIEQIIEVDSLVFDNKIKNEKILSDRKQEYVDKINNYRTEKLDEAKKKSKHISEETDAFIIDIEKKHDIQIQTVSTAMGEKYKRIEMDLIQKIFRKLFVSEEQHES